MRGRVFLFVLGFGVTTAQATQPRCATSVEWAQQRPLVASFRPPEEPAARFWSNANGGGVVSLRSLRDDASFRKFLLDEPVYGQVKLGEYAGIYQPEGRYSGHLTFAVGSHRKPHARYPYGRRLVFGWGHSFANSSVGYRDLAGLIASGPYETSFVPWGTPSSYSFHLDFDAFPGGDDDEKLRLFLAHVEGVLHRLEN